MAVACKMRYGKSCTKLLLQEQRKALLAWALAPRLPLSFQSMAVSTPIFLSCVATKSNPLLLNDNKSRLTGNYHAQAPKGAEVLSPPRAGAPDARRFCACWVSQRWETVRISNE